MNAATTCALAENPWLAQSVRIDAITSEIAGVATYHLRFTDRDLHDRYRFGPGNSTCFISLELVKSQSA
jgi:hypothetical protein